MMRTASLLLVSVVGTLAQWDQIQLKAFHCGNPARHHPSVSTNAGSLTFKTYAWDDNGNTALFFTSTHCNADPVPSSFPVVTSCVDPCKTARACATKVWPEHCEQGCEKDCSAYQVEPAAGWNIYSSADTYTGTLHIEMVVTVNGLGTSYRCDFTKAQLATPAYCVGKSTGASKEVSWPVFPGDVTELGAPWMKIALATGQASSATSAGTTSASITGALIDSDLSTGINSATKIDGAQMHTTCDGHCGTFAPMYGPSCTATTEAQVSGHGPGWHPASATDCYCSCTTDCLIVGDCCDDYNLCSSTDLTISGGVVVTQAPTHTNAGGASGDPFTEHAGKRTQFYLPLGRRVPLLKYKHVELWGEARPSMRKNDDQQWFKGFEVRYKGDSVIIVESVDTELLLRKAGPASALTSAATAAAAGDVDALAALRDRVARAKMELATTQVMRDNAGSDEVDIDSQMAGRKNLRSGQMPLSTLNVTVAGRRVPREVTGVTAASGDITIQVSQDQKHRIGSGFMESAWIEAPGIGFQLQSALAQKFDAMEDKIRHMHINLKFNELNATGCTGLLPEIWGVRPMTAETIKHLSPLSAMQS